MADAAFAGDGDVVLRHEVAERSQESGGVVAVDAVEQPLPDDELRLES
jgi:hypothetical protein